METTIENAIRSVARGCRTEIIEATDGKPIQEHDKLITEILDRNAKKLPPYHLTLSQLNAG
ncbi:TPA: hypothetical protein ACGPN1_002137 [Yersinia enterocolitica]